MCEIIGRKEEARLLEKFRKSQSAEFLALYGRRRIGKTFLIRQHFKSKGVFFEITGSYNAKNSEQLLNFHSEFCALFRKDGGFAPPKNWKEAFTRLINVVKNIKTKEKIVLFFDELPWLATKNSGFLSALDYAWNRHLSTMSNILLIVCGSAASWMISNVVNNTGGLYGRLSAHLRLLPFTLEEVEEYLVSRGVKLPKKQICELYMVTGGVPKYLSYVEPGMSSAAAIHQLCFMPQSPLLTEFHKLYHSLFSNPLPHLEIVKTLSQRRRGLSRKELLEKVEIKKGGRVSAILQELEEAGFIMTLSKIGKSIRDVRYYLSDEYTLFYLNWIYPNKGELLQGVHPDYWIKKQASQSWHIWAGFAFETLCLKHLGKIKNGLGIGGVNTQASYWKAESKGKKQIEIDLVIDRADQCMNLCEVKFHDRPFQVSSLYAKELEKKKRTFQEKTETKKALFTTLITPFGCKETMQYRSSVDVQLTLEDLF